MFSQGEAPSSDLRVESEVRVVFSPVPSLLGHGVSFFQVAIGLKASI